MERKVAALVVAPGIVALALCASFRTLAQESRMPQPKQLKASPQIAIADDSQPPSDQEIQLLRRDLRSQKKQIVAANMNLTDTEAEKFWPVYDRYSADLSKLYDTKMELVEQYFDTYKTMDGDQAESYLRRRAAVEESVMELRLKYVPEFRRVLSGRQTALFFQIEWRLDLMINLQLAEAPLIDP
jgi:hypothetical protein